jgi:hypothetical protein
LKHLRPSVVNTLHSGAGPLTVILLGYEHAAFART